jgi:hypothetical protein
LILSLFWVWGSLIWTCCQGGIPDFRHSQNLVWHKMDMSSSFNFPPTPPKDGTPENVNASTEYTPDSKPIKQQDAQDNQSPPYSHTTAHPMATYPSYVTPGSDYGFCVCDPRVEWCVEMRTTNLARPRNWNKIFIIYLTFFYEF